MEKNLKYLQFLFDKGFYPLEKIEEYYINRNLYKDIVPIFIIGLPRSGSTLLYQLLINRFKLCYFTNVSNFFYKSPVIISSICPNVRLINNSNLYKSSFGFTKGLLSPSEGGSIFRYWFDKLEYNNKAKNRILNSINKISNIYEAPFLSKNLYNNFRMDKINKLFNKPLFIYIKRENIFVAQSILMARKTFNNNYNYNTWFGVKPLDYERIRLINDPFVQVFEQIKSINSEIDTSSNDNKINLIKVNYEDLCTNAEVVLSSIANKYYEKSNVKLVPKVFKFNKIESMNNIKIKEKDWSRLNELFNT